MTLYNNGNLGAALQAYALNTVLQGMGHHCEDIRYCRVSDGFTDKQINRQNRKQLLRTGHGRRTFIRKAIISTLTKGKRRKRRERIQSFIDEMIPQSKGSFCGADELSSAQLPYDCYICGSDNIWNKYRFDPSYLLDFVPAGVRKFSYAAGLSASSFTPLETERFLPCMEKLDAISVRDSVGATLLRGLTKRDIREDIDPTMLLTASEWEKRSKAVNGLPEKYMFCYILGDNPEAHKTANAYRAATGLRIVTLPHATTIHCSDVAFGDVKRYDIGPAEFLTLVAKADAVITDSFHGCVFSVIFQKSFVVFRRFQAKQEHELDLRLDGLMEKVGVRGRIASETQEAMRILATTVDYSRVMRSVHRLREESLGYLEKMTGNIEGAEDRR